MRKAYIGVAVVLALALFCGSASAVTMYIAKVDGAMGTLGPITAMIGDTITIGVYAADVPMQAFAGLAGFQAYLDETGPATFNARAVVAPFVYPDHIGSWFKTGMVWPDMPAGADYATGMLLAGELHGGGIIANFSVTVNDMGTVTVDFVGPGSDSFLGDALGSVMDATYGDPLVINVVPEPATLTLLGVGLVGLLGLRRRK